MSKKLENVDYLNYLGGMITKDARCSREITSKIAVSKASFNKNKNFHLQVGLKFKEGTICAVALYGAKHLDTSESRAEIPGKV
jgi:hypothetical protein